jgi:hypothetical protein
MYFGRYATLVRDEAVARPVTRASIIPPEDYQKDALGQIAQHLLNSGVDRITLAQLVGLLTVGGLRDRLNPAFEPLSFPLIEQGLENLIERRMLTPEGEDAFAIHLPQSDDGEIDDAPGILDLLAESETTLPELAPIILELGPSLEQLRQLAQATTNELKQSDAHGGGAAGRLKVAVKLAAQLRPTAEAIRKLGLRNADAVAKIDPGVNAMLDEIEAQPDVAFQTEGIPEYVDGIRSIRRNGRTGADALKGTSDEWRVIAGYTRVLRPAVRDIQSGLRSFVDAQAIYEGWNKRLDVIEEGQAEAVG